MDNATFLAQMAHFAWAYGIILTAGFFGLRDGKLQALTWAFVAFALVKEFVYDLRFELPNDTFAGSAMDFAFYLFGLNSAWLVITLQRRRQ